MTASLQLSATVLVCTYNRAPRLRDMLATLCTTRTTRTWSAIVVDNNSTDATREVVTEAARTFPVPLLCVFQARQGKSYALNTGLERCTGDIIVFTDDDVRVVAGWLDAACGPLDRMPELDYTGGPVRPLWGARPPAWLDDTRGDLWGTLAILDYGPEPFVFEDRRRMPLGANMAVRRRLIDRIGGFHPDLGRRGHSLLGQEQAEFFARARAASARGLYVPAMVVEHHVPANRLSKAYFRRWWFWKGLSRARVDAIHQHTELGLDLRLVPRVAGVPRFVWGLMPRAAGRWIASVLRGDRRTAALEEMRMFYAIGYVRSCWSLRASQAHRVLPEQETTSVSR